LDSRFSIYIGKGIMITGYMQNGMVDEAKELFDRICTEWKECPAPGTGVGDPHHAARRSTTKF
jgi:pentatricopeptide repeat protein